MLFEKRRSFHCFYERSTWDMTEIPNFYSLISLGFGIKVEHIVILHWHFQSFIDFRLIIGWLWNVWCPSSSRIWNLVFQGLACWSVPVSWTVLMVSTLHFYRKRFICKGASSVRGRTNRVTLQTQHMQLERVPWSHSAPLFLLLLERCTEFNCTLLLK